jgi:hypothetical protein
VTLKDKAEKLASYIQSLPGFAMLPDIKYSHIGAIAVDALLQAGANYDAVKERVDKMLSIPQAKTTTGFVAFINELENRGESLNSYLSWDGRKPRWIRQFAIFLYQEGIETNLDLKRWLEIRENLPRLSEKHGFGNKTVDYLKKLAGISNIAIDRYWYDCLDKAGIPYIDYQDAKAIADEAADIMGVDKSVLDTSLWNWWRKNSPGSSCAQGLCS